jgi:plastocyanin
MMRRTLAIAAAATMLIASGAAGRATTTVQVADDFFDPTRVKISKKDKIAFEWVGTNEHDIAKTKGPGPSFDSGPKTGTGVLYTRKFKKAGTYRLICTLHQNMKMKVLVD